MPSGDTEAEVGESMGKWTALAATVLFSWALLPTISALQLIDWVDFGPKAWYLMVVVWIVSSIILLTILIFIKCESEARIGIICTICIGLPSIVLAVMSLTGEPYEFPYAVTSNKIISVEDDVGNSEERSAYIFLQDVSSTFVTKEDPENLDRSFAIIKLIQNTKSGIAFERQLLIKRNDACRTLVMGDKVGTGSGKASGDASGDYDARLQSDEELESLKTKILAKQINVNPAYTDIFDSIDSIIERYVNSDEYSLVNIIIFSDFIHDPQTNNADKSARRFEVEERATKVAAAIRSNPKFVVTAFAPSEVIEQPFSRNSMMDRGVQVLPLLKRELAEGSLRILSLDQIAGMDRYSKWAALSESLYRFESIDTTLYLTYCTQPRWEPDRRKIVFPKTMIGEKVCFSLHSESRDDESPTLRIADNSGILVSPSTRMGRNFYYPQWWRLRDDSVEISLGSRVRSSYVDGWELRVTLPELQKTYVIPIVIRKRMNDLLSTTLKALMFGIGFLTIPVSIVLGKGLARETGKGATGESTLGDKSEKDVYGE